MHVLTELKVKVGPVLLDAAHEHFRISEVEIEAFKLPVWMYEKVRRDEFEVFHDHE